VDTGRKQMVGVKCGTEHSETQKDWSHWLAYVTFCYNATEHSATGFPPFFVFTGRLTPVNCGLDTANNPGGKAVARVYSRGRE